MKTWSYFLTIPKDNPIPIKILNTGYNGNITINLSKLDFDSNMFLIDSIEIYPLYDSNVVSSDYLHSSTSSYGEY